MGSPVAIQLHCHALLLEVPTSFVDDPPPGSIRGFMTAGELPIFTHWLKCGPLEYEIEASADSNIFMSNDGALSPMFSGHRLAFKDGTGLSIVIDNQDANLEVNDYDNIGQVWDELPMKVLEHWGSPNCPMPYYISVVAAKLSLASRVT